VIHFLHEMSIDVVRFHPSEMNQDAYVTVDKTNSQIAVVSSSRTLRTSDILSVWFRRPENSWEPDDDFCPVDRLITSQETHATTWGLYGRLPGVWYSHPYRIRQAAWKMYQLWIAESCGLCAPPYIISNNPKELCEFANTQPEVVVKPIDEKTTCYEHDRKQYSLYVKKVDKESLFKLLGDIGRTMSPLYVQKYVRKKFDVRVTVIGGIIFAAAIFDSGGKEVVDFRPDSLNLSYRIIDCPERIRDGVITYLQKMRLNFGAFDFVVDDENNWYFLECNPNGQWLWIEIMTGLPLSKTFAEHLALRSPCLCTDWT